MSFLNKFTFLNPKQKTGVLLAVLFLLLIPSIYVVQKGGNDIRNRAAGSGEVDIGINTGSTTYGRGAQFTANVSMTKTATRSITVSGAQAVVDVPSAVFTINSATCVSPFNGTPYVSIAGSRVTLFCAISPGATAVSLSSTPSVFGSIVLTVNSSASLGASELTFVSTRATESGIEGQSPDVSTAGTNATITIVSTPSVTPAPLQWTIQAEARCTDGSVPPLNKATFASYQLWDLTTNEQSSSGDGQQIGLHTVTITAPSTNTNIYFWLMNPETSPSSVGLTPMGTPFYTGVSYGNVFGMPYQGMQWNSGTVPSGTYSVQFQAPASWCTTPSVTPTRTPTPTPTRTPTPSISVTPSVPISSTVTPTVTPPFNTDSYLISIGTKDSLTINIGAGEFLYMNFKTKLAHVENTPDLVLRMRVKDDLAFVQNPSSVDTCQAPGTGSRDFYIPVKADSAGVYSPSASSSASAPSGVTLATVDSDGWVRLPGLAQNKYYSFTLKAPKTRGTKTAEHITLTTGKPSSQNFDWTAEMLMPGDLPNPNTESRQDCTVNSVDLSLMIDRQGNTDQSSLDIADVTYDGVVNGNDISKVVNTLSTKPDDD